MGDEGALQTSISDVLSHRLLVEYSDGQKLRYFEEEEELGEAKEVWKYLSPEFCFESSNFSSNINNAIIIY